MIELFKVHSIKTKLSQQYSHRINHNTCIYKGNYDDETNNNTDNNNNLSVL